MGARLDSTTFTQVLTTPVSAVEDGDSQLRRAIVAGLLDSGVQGHHVASMWVRSEPNSALRVLVSGATPPGFDAEPRGSELPLLFPLGATGRMVAQNELRELVVPFAAWTSCVGSFDPLLDATDQSGRPSEQQWSASPLDDVVGYLSYRAFAWLVMCTPVPEKSVSEERDALGRELFRLHQSGRLSEADAVETERRQAWFRELSRAGLRGVWDVTIAVGSPDKESNQALASVLCTAAEQSSSRYRFRPSGVIASTADEALGQAEGGDARDRAPFRATKELVAALIRPPETELPGIRVVAPPAFDTTPEGHDGVVSNRVPLGTVLDRFLRPAGPLSVNMGTLNRHTFVCGATGGGKSQTVRGLLEALSRRPLPIPWLVIEPAKAEYARMAGRLEGVNGQGVLVIRPGDPHAIPTSMNPLEPASLDPGNPDQSFPLQSHADLVRALFLAAFHADEPFPQVLSRALTECYGSAGWDLVTSRPLRTWDRATGQPVRGDGPRSLPRYPTLGDLQIQAQRVVEGIGYGDDIKKNVRGFVDVRIGSLRLGTPGRFFEGGHPLDFAALLRHNVVVEIEGITNDQDKAFVMGALLIRLYEQLLLEEKERERELARLNVAERAERERSEPSLRHVTVIEEAHRLLRNVPLDSPAAHSLELFASLLAEVRAYREGIVVAEQIPSKLIPDVIKNTALKIVHRLPAADDREAVGATMNLSDAQSEYVVTLEPGVAAVFADGMDRPVLASMPYGGERESRDGEQKVRTGSLALIASNRRRSRSCGQGCRAEMPCNLSQIRGAERFLDAHPEITLWMEMSVAAHGIGVISPELVATPAVGALRAVASADPRLTDCAISLAVDTALATRNDRLAEYFDPESLGTHLADALRAMLTGGTSPCPSDDGLWRFGNQRYGDVRLGLNQLVSGGQSFIPYPALLDRARSRRAPLSGEDPKTDLRLIEFLPANRVGEHEMRLMLFGDGTPVVAIGAAIRIAGVGEEREQLDRACAETLCFNPADAQALLTTKLFPEQRPTPSPGRTP